MQLSIVKIKHRITESQTLMDETERITAETATDAWKHLRRENQLAARRVSMFSACYSFIHAFISDNWGP